MKGMGQKGALARENRGEVPLPQSFLLIVSCFAFHPALGQLEVALVRLLCGEVRPENLT